MALGGVLGLVWARVTPRHSAWQAWHLVTFTFVSRGRRGTNSHLPSFCVAGVALMVLGGALGPGLGGRDAGGAASLLRGRRGTILHPRSFCVAGVAQTRMYRRFVPSFCVAGVALMVLGGALGPGVGRDAGGAASLLRGRRGTILHPWSFCVAGVAQTRMYRRFVPSFCVAGMALMVLGGALGPGLGGRDAGGAASLLRGRRGTILHPRSFCVAGVAQTRMYRRFAWQAWHLWYWVAPLGPV